MIATSRVPFVEPVGWLGILRLGLVQTALGAIVVLTTSAINRIMVVELALPASLPGALVGLHYAVQALRPRWGHGADVGRRLTPWILGGMAILAAGGFLSAVAVAVMAQAFVAGLLLSILAFTAIGVGVGAAGTSLLVLLSRRVREERRSAAATVVWIMMIAGFVVTAATAGHFLDPFSMERLVLVSGSVSLLAFLLAAAAVRGMEGPAPAEPAQPPGERKVRFGDALNEVWSEPHSRLFTIFIFVSMLAYSAQDLILEPFGALVFGLTPGETTKLSGIQHGGVLVGMVVAALGVTWTKGNAVTATRIWTFGGCIASALALSGLVAAAVMGPAFPFRPNVFLLGLANGIFAAAAIGGMMRLVDQINPARAGVRMGLWGAAQGIAFGVGGFAGAIAADIARLALRSEAAAYATVFAVEAALFGVAAMIALRMARSVARLQPVGGQPRDTAGMTLGQPAE